MKALWNTLKARSVARLTTLAAVLALVALAIMVVSVIFPRPLVVILAMSGGHALGGAAFVCYLLAELNDVARTPDGDGGEMTINNVVFHPADRRVESNTDGLRRRKWAHSQACQTGDPFNRGDTFRVLFWVKGEDVEGNERWWVAQDGSRIWSGGTVETP